MIESGIYQWAIANAAIQAALGSPDRKDFTNSFYFSFIPKGPMLPCIVLDRLAGDEDDVDTLDVGSALPPTMNRAKFQFGSCANDNANNPLNPSGYLSAAALSQALRRQLKTLATGEAELPDGTIIKELHILDEFDAHFEQGGIGYLLRRVLQVELFFEEAA